MKRNVRKLMVSVMLVFLVAGLMSQGIFAASQSDSDAESKNIVSNCTGDETVDNGWGVLGKAGFSKGSANYTSIALDQNNIPYVAYVDGGNCGKVAVRKYMDNAWKAVGNDCFSAIKAKDTSVVIDKNNTPYVVYIEPDGKIIVNKFVNNKWTALGCNAGFGDYVSMAVDSKGTPYVAYTYSAKYKPMGINNVNGVIVSKYENGKWKVQFSLGSSIKNDYFSYPAIAIDSLNTPYIAFNHNGINIMKISNSGMSTYQKKNPKNEDVKFITMAIDNKRNPYVAFQGGNGKAVVRRYTSGKEVDQNNFWEISEGKAEYTSIALDGNGVPYVAYMDCENSCKAVVKKFEDGKWLALGNDGFSKCRANFTSMAVDGSGVPYVVYQDGAKCNKATVCIYQKTLPKAELTIKIEGDGRVEGWTEGSPCTKSFVLGTTVTLKAIAGENSKFLYWKDSIGHVVSTALEYSFDIGCDETLTAVFVENSKHLVTFKDGNGGILQTVYISEDDDVVFPEAPAMYGYKFIGWDKTADEIKAATEDIVVTALFEKVENTVTISVYGGTGSGNYSIKDYATVIADAPEMGKKFSHWVDEQGNILCYNTTYSFYVTRGLTLTAIYVAESEIIVKKANIVITNVTKTDGKITFVAERLVPDGNTIISHGILATKNALTGASESDFVIGGTDVLKFVADTKGLIGTFILNKIAALNETWYARGFVIYKDSDGNVFTLYSNIAQETMN